MCVNHKIIANQIDSESYDFEKELRLGWIAARQLNTIGRVDFTHPTFEEFEKEYWIHRDKILKEGKCGQCLGSFQSRFAKAWKQIRKDSAGKEETFRVFLESANHVVSALGEIVKIFDYIESSRTGDKQREEMALIKMLEMFSRYFVNKGYRIKIYRITPSKHQLTPDALVAGSFVKFDRDSNGNICVTKDFWSRFSPIFNNITPEWNLIITQGETLMKAIENPDSVISIEGEQRLRYDRENSDFYLKYIDLHNFPSMVIKIIKPVTDLYSLPPHFNLMMDNLIKTLESALMSFDRKVSEMLTAVIDKRTGLFAHSQFEAQVTRMIGSSLRQQKAPFGEMMSMVVLDIDNFKLFNELLGHNGGDKVLGFFGKLIKESFRTTSTDVGIRYGGEEFVILMQKVTKQEAVKLMEAFKEKLAVEQGENADIRSDTTLKESVSYKGIVYPKGHMLPITFSGGVADLEDVLSMLGLPREKGSVGGFEINTFGVGQAMFKIADGLLLGVKKGGKNRTICDPIKLKNIDVYRRREPGKMIDEEDNREGD